jgi:hypothetical protein
MGKGLSDKQLKFIELWNGSPTQTAEMAGYSHPVTAGKRCMKNVAMCTRIKEKRAAEVKPLVANRIDRQKFWTETMQSAEEKIDARLKASELLGKSEGDFLDRIHQTGDMKHTIRWANE